MKYLLALVFMGMNAADAKVDEALRCQLALLNASRPRLEFAPGLAMGLIADPNRFELELPDLITHAVPSPGAAEPETFQALYIQDKQTDDLVHVEFRLARPGVIRVSSLLKAVGFQATAFYGTYAYHHHFETTVFQMVPGEEAIRVGADTFSRVNLSGTVRAKIWLKQRLEFADILAIIRKVRFATPMQNPGVSSACVHYKRAPYRLYFFKTGHEISLRTIYKTGPATERKRKPRPTQPEA